ncbi:MAG: PD-(D/E)XK nuclease family protein [Gemmatimonadota bacterium]
MSPLSTSAITLYLDCPQGFKLHHLERHPHRPAPPRNKGGAVHAALGAMYRERLHGPPPIEHVLDAFDEAFDDEAYLTFDEREDAYADGTLMLQRYFAAHAGVRFRPAMAVEARLRLEVAGAQVVAVIDRIDKLESGKARVVDYRTGRLPTREQAEASPQLALYQMAVEDQLGLEVEELQLYHVPSLTPIAVPRLDEERLEATRTRVRDVVRGIETGEFEPVPQKRCAYCDWREHCVLFADWYPEAREREPSPAAPSREEARTLADRFGRLREEVRERKEELVRVREALERFFEETGERAVSGDAWRLTARRRAGRKFPDESAVRAALEPAGLWDRVLAPDGGRTARLASDPGLPEDVRARLEQAGVEEVEWRVGVRRLE